jgi:NADPH-dependent 2,4-dienoyl-CoA reductase/sulfur reductase-like enzyme
VSVPPTSDPFAFRFEGRTVPFADGMTIAAALVAAGELGLRQTRDGGHRGIFCGMGVCQECLVAVDGRPGRRACMTAAVPGGEVTRQPARPDLSTARPNTLMSGFLPSAGGNTLASAFAREEPERHDAPDVLVVGGGPGGLTAATAAAEVGLRVVVLDERAKPGGQYFKQPASRGWGAGPRPDHQFAAGAALIDRARAAGVQLISGAQLWGAFATDDLAVLAPDGRYRFAPRALILAPGAYERGMPVPGWTLPGVMTTGAAQTLWRSYGTPPGRRVLVSGNGPLNMQVAAELARAGASVVALAELATPAAPDRVRALARMAAADRSLIGDGLRYRAALARARVPVLYGAMVTAIAGDDRARTAVVSQIDVTGRVRPGTERRFEVDAVCMGFGFHPSNEIARALGARHAYRRGQLQTVVDELGRTSLPHVWVVGDGAWIGGAKLAQAVGELAGLDVARALDGTVTPAQRKRERAATSRAARHRRFQSGLATAFAAPLIEDQLASPQTHICRCEEVTRDTLERALADGPGHIGALKRATRAGMGPCQGRYCGPLIAAMTARRIGEDLTEMSGFAPNPPVKPVTIADLLGSEGDDEAVATAIRAARTKLAGDPAGDRD